MFQTNRNSPLQLSIDKELASDLFKRKLTFLTAEEIKRQLPIICEDDYRVQSIIRDSLDRIQSNIALNVNYEIMRLTRDPDYHKIHCFYFDSFMKKGDEAIAAFVKQTEQRIQEMSCQPGQRCQRCERCDSFHNHMEQIAMLKNYLVGLLALFILLFAFTLYYNMITWTVKLQNNTKDEMFICINRLKNIIS